MINDAPAASPGGQKSTVLVVDDDPASRAYLADALEGLGCRVLQAAEGGAALRALTEDRPDLIFTDLMMPGMDGLEFLALARTHVPGLPLVLVTACDQGEAATEAIGSGAAAFLRKPVSLADLATVLERFPPASRNAGQLVNSSNGQFGDEGRKTQTDNLTARPIHQLTHVSGLGGLDPALLHKATQLSLLTRFGSALRAPSASLLPLAMPGTESRVGMPDIGPLVHRSLDIVLRALPGEQAVLALTEDGRVQTVASRGRNDFRLPLEEVAARTREGEAGRPWHGLLEGIALVAVPLAIQGAGVGLICVGRGPSAPGFTWADRELLAAFSAETAVALENACLARQLERSFQETVTSLIVTLEARDKYTEGHSLRVADYASAIAVRLQCGPAVREQVRTASLLHDLGKVGVRDAILEKPGRLTPEEWAAMRQHPVLGWKILGPLGFLAAEAEGVRHHHEHFDGTGYPDGLAGEAIPLSARIIAVADTFDAMTTARPYRPSRSPQDALAEIRRSARRQFDPTVVDAFQACYEGWSIQHRAA